MACSKLRVFSVILFLVTINEWYRVEGKTKVFIFGDSYADTGNNAKTKSCSWKNPYGMTFPKKPSGRFSDGRVLSDFFARFVGVRSPIPYRWRKYGSSSSSKNNGMNFAYGGTGVMKTLSPGPNMTTQIRYLEKLAKESFYSYDDLQSSVALVTLAGNDYSAFLAGGGSELAMPEFIQRVVEQLSLNLKMIKQMGVKKVVVTGLQPLGCLPMNTAISSFRDCNATQNDAVLEHNRLLQHAVRQLNIATKSSSFFMLDLYSSFMLVLNKSITSGRRFENVLRPCCNGNRPEYSCCDTNGRGEPLHTVCEDPESAFFWDSVHPTQMGWTAVYSLLKSSLLNL